MLRRVAFVSAWAFIFAAAAYDGYFAWCFQEAFQGWELNPVVRWAALNVGIGGVLAFKFGGLAFAAGLAVYCVRRRSRLAAPLTVCVATAYLLLSLHYMVNVSPFMEQFPPSLAARRVADGQAPLLGR